jgi:O-antigen/teichoic acid export membrane protein
LSVKKLASQTLWYGIPTIANRFLGYLMNLSLPFIFKQPGTTADLTQVYAIIPFLNVLFTYGMETAYFRFHRKKNANNCTVHFHFRYFFQRFFFRSVFILFALISPTGRASITSSICDVDVLDLFFDTLATLPFARLRQEGRQGNMHLSGWQE